nr:hypothetical protein [Endozoicomonas sp.]
SLEKWPEQLKLSFLSPAFQSQDKIITLNRSFSDNSNEPVYVGQLEQAVTGRYYLQLETEDLMIPEVGYQSGWKITLEAQVSPGTPILLKNPEA